MNPEYDSSKPCILQTGQGLSVLYKGRYLYSRYNPAATAEKTVAATVLRPDSLILCNSPVLGYGLESLAERMPSGCFVLVVETDPELYALYNSQTIPHGFGLLSPEDTGSLVRLLNTPGATASNGVPVPPPGTFRRCIRLDLSGAVQLDADRYQQIQQIADNSIAVFWKNRITLVQMGRLYHRNIFRNLALLPWAKPIQPASVVKPIVVIGAGPSAEKTVAEAARLPESVRNRLFILAVDAAAGMLILHKIVPDAVVALEPQIAIQQAYSDCINAGFQIYADVCSRPGVLRNNRSLPAQPAQGTIQNIAGGPVSFFSSRFAATQFFRRMEQAGILPAELPPLGSVGITATELALMLRQTSTVPVLVTGLDFSFPPGKTHAAGTMQQKQMLLQANRLCPPGNPKAAFQERTELVPGKDKPVYANRILMQYRDIFETRYAQVQNLFDGGSSGMRLGIPSRTGLFELAALATDTTLNQKKNGTDDTRQPYNPELAERVLEFYNAEEAALLELRNSLMYGGSWNRELEHILSGREYLYLHFPDGYRVSTEIPFLKRVRAEIDFFLKDIRNGRAELIYNRTRK